MGEVIKFRGNGIKDVITVEKVTLDLIKKSDFQKEGTKTAQIRQKVATISHYPAKKVGSSKQPSLVPQEAFGFKEQLFPSVENRMAFVDVPEAYTNEDVQKLLDDVNAKGGVIYKELSNKPIIDENQQSAIDRGLKSLDDFGNTQVVRVPTNDETELDGTADTVVLDKNANVQYRRTFLWGEGHKDDIDTRDANDFYVTKDVEAELQGASVMQAQQL